VVSEGAEHRPGAQRHKHLWVGTSSSAAAISSSTRPWRHCQPGTSRRCVLMSAIQVDIASRHRVATGPALHRLALCPAEPAEWRLPSRDGWRAYAFLPTSRRGGHRCLRAGHVTPALWRDLCLGNHNRLGGGVRGTNRRRTEDCPSDRRHPPPGAASQGVLDARRRQCRASRIGRGDPRSAHLLDPATRSSGDLAFVDGGRCVGKSTAGLRSHRNLATQVLRGPSTSESPDASS
jgi:hypothetical protein